MAMMATRNDFEGPPWPPPWTQEPSIETRAREIRQYQADFLTRMPTHSLVPVGLKCAKCDLSQVVMLPEQFNTSILAKLPCSGCGTCRMLLGPIPAGTLT
jgi:hypothetical protein